MGGEGPSMDFEQSKQQKWLWDNMVQPYYENMQSGNMPDMWQVPDISQMMPGKNWWDDLDPNIKAGIREPYTDASQQMLEVMGAKGQVGSGGSGYGGQTNSATGQFWNDAASGMAQTGWGMVSPALQQGWQAQFGQNQAQYAQDMMPYGMLQDNAQMSMPYPVVDPGSAGFGPTAMSMLMPWTLFGNAPQYPGSSNAPASPGGMAGSSAYRQGGPSMGSGIANAYLGQYMPWSSGSGFGTQQY